jgi:hypothetical protein
LYVKLTDPCDKTGCPRHLQEGSNCPEDGGSVFLINSGDRMQEYATVRIFTSVRTGGVMYGFSFFVSGVSAV